MRWWRKKRSGNQRASDEAKSARRDAEVSKRQAEKDRAQARQRWAESRPVVEQIKAHNKANHFDQWLQEQLRNGRT